MTEHFPEHFLNSREITVLTLRFGLADGRSRTLENTSKELEPIEDVGVHQLVVLSA